MSFTNQERKRGIYSRSASKGEGFCSSPPQLCANCNILEFEFLPPQLKTTPPVSRHCSLLPTAREFSETVGRKFSSAYFVKLISKLETLGKFCQSVKGKVALHPRVYSPNPALQGGDLQVQLAVSRAIEFTEEYSLPGTKDQPPAGNDHCLGRSDQTGLNVRR